MALLRTQLKTVTFQPCSVQLLLLPGEAGQATRKGMRAVPRFLSIWASQLFVWHGRAAAFLGNP